jgi:hypothetical protein
VRSLSSRDNAALKLRDWLAEDKALRRFSMISFDTDVLSNFKAIQRQVMQGRVVGQIAAHNPDFEFANFDITELVEIAARLDETYNFSGDSLRNADWTGVLNGRAFAEKYRQLSLRKSAGLKGEQWGRALAAFCA